MDRREVQRRRLAVEAFMGQVNEPLCKDIGRVASHNIEPEEIIQGEPYYEIRLVPETGEVTVTPFIGGDIGLLDD